MQVNLLTPYTPELPQNRPIQHWQLQFSALCTVCVDLMRAHDPVSSPFWNLSLSMSWEGQGEGTGGGELGGTGGGELGGTGGGERARGLHEQGRER